MSTSNSGFGKGCSIGYSHYDTQGRLLTLSTGERYKVTETHDQPIIEQKKLDNFRFEKHAKAYKIIYKSGVVEILAGPQTGDDIKVPLEIYSPVGHKLTLNWEYSTGKPRLRSVADEKKKKNTLLEITYSVDTKVKVWTETKEAHEIVFEFANDYLIKVDNNALDSPLSWKFDYDTVGEHYLITKLEAPTGLIDQVYYTAESMKFPDNAHLPALPAVRRYVQYPGFGQPPIETLYDYSDTNYLGYGSTVDWSPDRDNLYGILDGYEYYSHETLKGGSVEIRTKRTYNNFHLLTQEEVSQGSASRTTQTEYYALEGKLFDDQPVQFQLPKSQTTTYKDTRKPEGKQSRSEVTQTEFDAAGNLIKKITPDGTITLLEYYEKSGEKGCPADPHGFVRFIKKQSVRPSASEFSAPVQTTEYTYGSFSSRKGSPVAKTVLLTQEKHYSDEKLLLKKTTGYVNDPVSGEHGRMNQIKTKRYDLNDSTKTYENKQDFTFKIQSEVLLQEAQFTGHDGLKSTIKKEQSRYSGKLISETDSQGNKASYTYDKLGRILRRTLNPGTEYENTITTEYSLIKDNKGKATEISTTQTDPKGNKERTYFDGMGRTLKQVRNDIDSAVGKTSNKDFIEILKQDYDALGRKKRVTTFDHGIGKKDPETQLEQTTLEAEASYDLWGENHLVSFSDGHKEYTLYDPIAMESTAYMQAEDVNQGKQVTKYNKQGLPISITNLDASGNEKGIIKHLYDGLGQLREITDELGQVTRYEYDALGRVITQTLPDGTLITKAYARHSGEALISGIGVRDPLGGTFLLGAQSFDSFGRLTESESGGRKYLYQYEGASPTPSKVTTPAGEEINYHYIPQLGNALEKLKYKVGESTYQQVFTYDKLTGLLTEADQTQGMARRMTYKPSGLLENELFSPLGEESQEASYTYSLLGGPRSYVDVSGAHQSYSYDGLGRHILTDDALVKVEFGYDQLGRLLERKATNKATGACMKATFTYDDLNREVKREMTLNNDAIAVIESSYRLNNQLERRTTKRTQTTLRQEDFTYDNRNRLTQYACSGSELPEDAYGKAIKKQSFTYDVLGNIKVCITEFQGGSDTATFNYNNAKDPTQLTSVSHTHENYPTSIELQYDANGRLIHDEAARGLSYDALGRLSALSVNGIERGTYTYDALDNLVGQRISENDQRELYYLGDILVNEIHRKGNKKEHIRLIKDGNATLAISSDNLQLTAIDAMGSLLSAVSAQGSRQDFRYSPYGSSAGRSSAISLVGFNGERMDPISGTYHLGNGYRAYNPVLMRFNCPDSLSPFGAGGINPYVYCLGDPINRLDPSGHLSWQASLGIGLGILGLIVTGGFAIGAIVAAGGVAAAWSAASTTALVFGTLGVASDLTAIASGAAEQYNPEASAILGWISLGTGLAGITRAGYSVGKAAARGVSNLSKRVKPIREQGLSGRGAPRAAARWAEENLQQIPQEALGNGLIKNTKPELLSHEGQRFIKATAEKGVDFNIIRSKGDLKRVVKSREHVHKFVFTEENELFVGSIKKSLDPKELSHAMLASIGEYENVISAGYIQKSLGKIRIVNHSGHFKPSFDRLLPVKNYLKNLGIKASETKAGSLMHGITKLMPF